MLKIGSFKVKKNINQYNKLLTNEIYDGVASTLTFTFRNWSFCPKQFLLQPL